jgi:mRNA-degrading endonuclease toxin of MazEF toxin-antitoxin module
MEQIRTVDKSRLQTKIGEVDEITLTKVNLSLIVSLSLQVA